MVKGLRVQTVESEGNQGNLDQPPFLPTKLDLFFHCISRESPTPNPSSLLTHLTTSPELWGQIFMAAEGHSGSGIATLMRSHKAQRGL